MFRFFEIIPGLLAWATLAGMVFFSWKFPAAVAIFIILFDIYWLLKTIYLSLHLRSTFKKMRANLRVNWLERLQNLESRISNLDMQSDASPDSRFQIPDSPQWADLRHLIIFPMYQEPYEVVAESFESLLATNYPKEKFMVVLATEERGGEEGQVTAKRIEAEFGGRFGKFLVTRHPDGLPGEIPGKGANETWAAKEAKRVLVDSEAIPYEHILVSVFDIDTQNFPEYFGRLTYLFLTVPKPLRAIYQPIPLFTNNIYQAPALARVVAFSTTFWQMMQQARPERLTSFSSQSIPFAALVDIGFWTTNVVSEDSHIFWQGFLHYDSDFRVVPLEYPVSMDANVAPTFWKTMRSIYKQHRRWGWGSENVPYLLEGLRTNPRIPRRKKWYWSVITVEGYWSWATNSLLIFALGWLPIILGDKAFTATYLSYSLPRITSFIVNISMLGIATSAVMALLLLPKTAEQRSVRLLGYFLEWILTPVTLIVFGAIPAIEAQTRLMLGGRWRLGFWVTPKGRYTKKNLESGI